MWVWLPVPLLYFSLALLLRAEGRTPRAERQIFIWKPLATLLVIVVCLLSFVRPGGSYDTSYSLLILVGLSLSLAGDVLLIPQDNPQAFLSGLVAFLSAHLLYIAAFVYAQISQALGRHGLGEGISALVLALIGGSVYEFLRPGLGKMRLPVVIYIFAISGMVHRAVAIALVHPGASSSSALIVAGAILFYLSDAILALNRFRLGGKMPYYRHLNLSTYYTGQLLIALSSWFLWT